MGRPRKNATVGGNAIPVMNGSWDSPKASTATVNACSLRRSGRLKSRTLLTIEAPKDILPNPEPNKELLPNPEPNKEILPNPEPNKEISSDPVPNKESLSNQVPANEGLFNPVPNNMSNPVANEGTDVARLESKIDFLVEAVKEFKHEGVKRASPDETTPTQELTYKSMYFESQRKIQVMEDEIRELSKDNEIAQAKVVMLQQINVSLQNMNNISLVSNFGKATEAIVSLAAQGKLNVPEEGGTDPALPQTQIVAADQNKEASPPARRNPKRAR